MTDGWEVMTLGWDVKTDGWPVITPRELVREVYCSEGLEMEVSGVVVRLGVSGERAVVEDAGAWIWPSEIWVTADMVMVEVSWAWVLVRRDAAKARRRMLMLKGMCIFAFVLTAWERGEDVCLSFCFP